MKYSVIAITTSALLLTGSVYPALAAKRDSQANTINPAQVSQLASQANQAIQSAKANEQQQVTQFQSIIQQLNQVAANPSVASLATSLQPLTTELQNEIAQLNGLTNPQQAKQLLNKMESAIETAKEHLNKAQGTDSAKNKKNLAKEALGNEKDFVSNVNERVRELQKAVAKLNSGNPSNEKLNRLQKDIGKLSAAVSKMDQRFAAAEQKLQAQAGVTPGSSSNSGASTNSTSSTGNNPPAPPAPPAS